MPLLFVHNQDVPHEIALVGEDAAARRARVGPDLVMHRAHVLGAVRLLAKGRVTARTQVRFELLVDGPDVLVPVVLLLEAVATGVTPVRPLAEMHHPHVLLQVVPTTKRQTAAGARVRRLFLRERMQRRWQQRLGGRNPGRGSRLRQRQRIDVGPGAGEAPVRWQRPQRRLVRIPLLVLWMGRRLLLWRHIEERLCSAGSGACAEMATRAAAAGHAHRRWSRHGRAHSTATAWWAATTIIRRRVPQAPRFEEALLVAPAAGTSSAATARWPTDSATASGTSWRRHGRGHPWWPRVEEARQAGGCLRIQGVLRRLHRGWCLGGRWTDHPIRLKAAARLT